jgi:hypothetical protein
VGILQRQSGMTISVYRIDGDGNRKLIKPLTHYEVHAGDPRPPYPANDPPCTCDLCDPEQPRPSH